MKRLDSFDVVIYVVLFFGFAFGLIGGKKVDHNDAPRLELRAVPKFALNPQIFLLTGELRGNVDSEKYYCLDQEWHWIDLDTKSFRESDCDPWQPGMVVERRFSISKGFGPGEHEVELRLVKEGKIVLFASATVRVLGEIPQSTEEPPKEHKP